MFGHLVTNLHYVGNLETVKGTKQKGLNRNGDRDANEPGLSGVTVYNDIILNIEKSDRYYDNTEFYWDKLGTCFSDRFLIKLKFQTSRQLNQA